MKSIAHEILRLLVERHPELLVGYDIEPHLQRFGDDLLPGLIDALNDCDPDVRRLAIGVLGLSRPQSDVALPLIIERLSDEDRLVRLSTLWALMREFKPLPPEVIPHLENWLGHDDEFERLNAMAGVSAADPNRKEFLPDLWEALNDESSLGNEIAMEFYGIEFPQPTDDDWDELLSKLDELRATHGLKKSPMIHATVFRNGVIDFLRVDLRGLQRSKKWSSKVQWQMLDSSGSILKYDKW